MNESVPRQMLFGISTRNLTKNKTIDTGLVANECLFNFALKNKNKHFHD